MLVTTLLLFSIPTTFAYPQLQARQSGDFTQWSLPGPSDVRAPCPGLNSLANHGILPHSGKGITFPILRDALAQLNVGVDLAAGLFAAAVNNGLTSNGAFDLDALDRHNAIEHDGSLSRADAFTGDNHAFNSTIFNSYMQFYNGMDMATPAVAGKARMARIKTERARDPEFTYGLKQQITSNAETAVLLGIMGDIKSGNAPVEYIKIFFEQERFPYAEGWRPSTTAINFLNFNHLIIKIMLAAGEILEDGKIVTLQTLEEVMKGLSGHFSSP